MPPPATAPGKEKDDVTVKLALVGAAGRMGRQTIALAAEQPDCRLVAALEAPGHAELGRDVGELVGRGRCGVVLSDRCAVDFDVLIDFSLPAGTMLWLAECARRGRPLVIAATGHDAVATARIREAAKHIAILKAANLSIGVNVLLRLARQLGEILDPSWDVEICEAHHRGKRDAPSGTALALRDAVAAGRGARGDGDPETIHGRRGQTGPRPVGQIALHSLRLGDTVGEHAVAFGAWGETLTIAHSAHSREIFAAGALRAARWLVGRPAGLYDMPDVLFG